MHQDPHQGIFLKSNMSDHPHAKLRITKQYGEILDFSSPLSLSSKAISFYQFQISVII